MDKDLQHRLSEYATPPSEGVWEAINRTLDESLPALGQKLQQFSAPPPPSSWEKIETQLNGVSIPVSRERSIGWLRYVAAAVVILALGYFLVLWTNSEGNGPGKTAIDNPPVSSGNKQETVPKDQIVESTINNTRTEPQPTSKSSKNKSGLEKIFTSVSRTVKHIEPSPGFTVASVTPAFIAARAEPKHTVPQIQEDKYMIYSEEKGHAIRLPKKLFSFFACIKEDISCQQRMLQLQESFSGASMNGDFMSVVEVLKNLKENQ